MDTTYVVQVEPLIKPHTERDPSFVLEYRNDHPNCEICGKWLTEVHHIVHRWHGPDTWENLIALCKPCHASVHGDGKITSKQLEQIKNSPLG